MKPEHWQQVTELFHAALACDASARAAYLDHACAGDRALRKDVDAMLAAHSAGAQFGDSPVQVSTVHTAFLASGSMIGPYRIDQLIGVGGMGEVYRARDPKLGRDVAIKILPASFALEPTRVRRFEREARVLAALNHPNIAAIHSFEETPSAGPGQATVHALVLEFVDGPTLADRLAKGPLPIAEAVAIARQIADALEAAHEKGIVHRDLKPANIKVTSDGTVKVLDFGLAKAIAGDGSGADVSQFLMVTEEGTREGVIAGTVAYMSPEQAQGKPVDKRTDVWAFGCVLYEMLTGRRPFEAHDMGGLLAAVLTSEPDWRALPGALTAPLRTFLRHCLVKNPKERVRDIGDIRLALDGGADAPPAVGVERTNAPVRRNHVMVWTAATVLIGGLAALAAWLATPRPQALSIAFTLAAPDGAQFVQPLMMPQPALSADGSQLAFVTGELSTSMIWIQRLGAREARPLPGTENGAFPFWSPDGEFVGFFAQRRLKKIAISGDRIPQDVCECLAGTSGGTWSADGTIVFGGAEGRLFRVSSDGGTPESLTAIDTSHGELSHRHPVLLPDGRRFVYLVRSSQAAHRGLYLGSLDDPSLKRRLLPDDSNAGYGIGPDGRGHIFFVRDGALLAQPFDTSRGQLVADPRVVALPVAPGGGGRLSPFAVADRTVVYRLAGVSRNRLIWIDRRGLVQGYVGVPGADYLSPSLSPDEARLAVGLRDPRTGRQDVWVLDLSRQTSQRLTADPFGAMMPTWMPDGSKVVFASARNGPWDLYSRAPAGNDEEQVLLQASEPENKYARAVTPDGRHVLFHSGEGIWTLSLDGEHRPRLLLRSSTPGSISHARVSPDGRWLAYASTETGQSQVYVTSYPELSERWLISPNGGTDPQWRRDGRELFYLAPDQTLMAVAVSPGAEFKPGTPAPLFRARFERTEASGSAFSPTGDGQRFLVNEAMADDEVVLNVRMNWTLDER